ncbi:MAG: DsbA family protein [Bdellovibrio sp.]|nr:MAG: DsbA family protein [Bdellovibrio sp.]
MKTVLLTLLLFLISCSSRKHSLVFNYGQIPFTISPKARPLDAISLKEKVASVNGEIIPVQQILDNAPSLNELLAKERDILMGLTYRMTSEKYKDKDVHIKFFSSEPSQGFSKLLKSLGIEENPHIQVEFIPSSDQKKWAQINDTFIKKSDVPLNHLQYWDTKNKQFYEVLRRLKGIIVRRLLFQMAQQEKVGVEDFIQKHIITAPINVTDSDVEELAQKQGIVKEELTKPLKKRLKMILHEERKNHQIEKFIKKALKGPVVLYVKKPANKIILKENWAISSHNPEALVTFTLFNNLTCTPCKKLNKLALQLKSNKDIRVVFRPFFMPQDRSSRMLFEAAQCVNDQNTNLFWKFVKAYTLPDKETSEEEIYKTVKEIHADFDQFKPCFLNRKFKDVVDYHLKYARYIGVTSLPSFFINGEIYFGPVDDQKINDQIAYHIEEAQSRLNFFQRIWRALKKLF